MMNRVIPKDGTSIAYERLGREPPVIMVTGGLDDGSENAPLARERAKHFTVYLAESRRDDALELFMRLAGSPDEQIQASRNGEKQ
jgi:hypothetical protein